MVAVRYPSDESSKFPHFPAVKDQLDFELGKASDGKSHKKVNIRPVRQKPANTYREDSQSQPSYEIYDYTTSPTTATTSTTTSSIEKNTKSRGGNYNGKNFFLHFSVLGRKLLLGLMVIKSLI